MKLITLDNLKTFLDKLLDQISTDVYTKKEVDEKLSKMNTKSDGYSKVEIDEKLKEIKKINNNADADKFFGWLKERNYDLTNFQGLDGTFPVKDFPEIKADNLVGGDTKIAGTGAPNTIVEYGGKQAQIGSDGHFLLEGITPLVDGELIQITCYDYAGRKKPFSIAVGKIEYAVPEGTTEITYSIVEQYNLNRAGRLIFPPSVKTVNASVLYNCTLLTDISLPACTRVDTSALRNCSSLKNASLPLCTSIGRSAFDSCSLLTNVSLPACVSVGDYAFWDCNKLQTLVLSDGWTPSPKANIPTTATVYNQDKTKKVDWKTMSWVNV